MTTASMNSINCMQTMVKADSPAKGKRFIKVKEGVETYCMGKTKLLMEARKSGALIKMGTLVANRELPVLLKAKEIIEDREII